MLSQVRACMPESQELVCHVIKPARSKLLALCMCILRHVLLQHAAAACAATAAGNFLTRVSLPLNVVLGSCQVV